MPSLKQLANTRMILIIVAIIGILLMPGVIPSTYLLHVLILAFMYLTLAVGWNFVAGYGGQFFLGIHLFIGTGMYTTTLLYLSGIPIFLCLLGGVVLSAVIAAAIGYTFRRLSGSSYAVASLAITEAVVVFIANTAVLGQTKGFYIPYFDVPQMYYYYLSFAVALLAVVVVYRTMNSDFGIAVLSIREDELAANALGVNATAYKMLVLMVLGAFSGFVGGFYSIYNFYIEPFTAFSFTWMTDVLLIAYIGGIGYFFGPIIGLFLFLFLIEQVRYMWPPVGHILIAGLILITVGILFPEGILGQLRRMRRKKELNNSPHHV